MRESKSVFSSAEERKSLFFLKFLVSGVPTNKRQKRAKKTSLFCVVLSNTLFSLSGVLSDRLFQRINQISLHLLSRNSIALFHKGVFIYQNAVISVILLSSRHRRERESRKRKYSLS